MQSPSPAADPTPTPNGAQPQSTAAPVVVEVHHEPDEVINKLLSPDDLLNVWGWATSIASLAVDKTKTAVETAKTISAPLLSATLQVSDPIASSSSSKPDDAIAPLPWEAAPPEHMQDVRARILKLSSDDKTFLVPPPAEAGFVYMANDKAAERLLETDPLLSAKRFKLVPKMVDEVGFWTNYFYRVQLILGAMIGSVKHDSEALKPAQSPEQQPQQQNEGEDWEEEMRKELAAVRNDDEDNFDMLDDGEVFEEEEDVHTMARKVKEELNL